MEVLLIGSVFLVLMILGVPIGTSLGVAGVVTIYQFDLGIEMLGVNFASGIASFPPSGHPVFRAGRGHPGSGRAGGHDCPFF